MTKEENITIVSRDDRRRGRTNWAKLDKLTDAEIEAAMAKDPAWADFDDADWSEAVLVIPPKKRAQVPEALPVRHQPAGGCARLLVKDS